MAVITSSKQFRKGRVLHNATMDTVLVESPAPRQWHVITVDPVTQEWALHKNVSSAVLRKNYTHLSIGLRNPFDTVKARRIRDTVQDALGVPMVSYLIARALSIRSYGAPALATPKAATAAALSEKSKAILDDLTKPIKPAPVVKPTVIGSRSTTFSVPSLSEKPYWYESESDRRLYRDFISLRQAGHTVNLMVAGPSGSGKTVGIQHLGEELGIPVHIVNCQAITTPEKWLGMMMADPEKGTYFEPSQHIQWVERTHPDCAGSEVCILLYDEITRLRAELNNMTYSLFDTQRGLEVPQMGRRAVMHPNNLIIATANIGAAFAGTFGQDRAFRERFSMTLERDFPPADEEIKIITSATGVDEASASALVKVAGATRRMWKEQKIEQPISTRTLVTWSLLVSGGYTIMQAADYTVLPLYSEDGGVDSDRSQVRLQIDGKAA